MNTNGHYIVRRAGFRGEGDILSLTCVHCHFRLDPRSFRRMGDRSGLPKYSRARALMVKHLHEKHRDVMGGASTAATTREG